MRTFKPHGKGHSNNAMPERTHTQDPRTESGSPRLTPARDDTHADTQPAITVLYDGDCPLCRREIGLYRGLKAQQPVCFADVNDPQLALPTGATRAQLQARFHVRRSDGTLLSGAQAFLALWAALPGWRWLARAGRLPGAGWVLECGYRAFLRVRPTLQRWAARLTR